ncbi:cupin domain-containing protein [Agromyces allii]|uniref:(S)-ureidoglycine aminohydrolase cupin domain-containing protein n=1 Tax=Agromyces allii TaxID=393607 RepID=A0ABP5BB43_9MICO|nr:cupin domain-containing protein [Agromyces allii]
MSLAADYTPAELRDLALEPTGAPARVLAGDPQTAEHVLAVRDGLEIGVWEVTPGEFASAKPTSGEVMQFLSGEGSITHADGSVTRIAPGSVLVLEPGWTGTWRVSATVRKVYTIFDAVPAAATETPAAASSEASETQRNTADI